MRGGMQYLKIGITFEILLDLLVPYSLCSSSNMRPLYFGLLGLCTTAASVSPLVDVGYSKYQGTKLLNGITQWLGIRYAAPPVGDLRFRAARDPIVDHVLHVADEVINGSAS